VTAGRLFLAQTAALVLFPIAGLAGAVVAAVAFGLANAVGELIIVTALQRSFPPAFLGRIMGLVMLASAGAFPYLDGVFRCCWRCAMSGGDRIIRWSTALAVLGVAAVAAVAAYEHAYDLVRAHREAGWTALMIPLTVDGLMCASSMVMLDSARRKTPVPALARWLLGLGIAATLSTNPAVPTFLHTRRGGAPTIGCGRGPRCAPAG
jgi:hypothetical protein